MLRNGVVLGLLMALPGAGCVKPVTVPGDAVPAALLLRYSIGGVDYGEFPLVNEPHQFK